ncbi:MAG: GAF domain-containing protein, partial [Anaerolineae bacterium]|nr:GAF domain-containing protein [Anaerolineae bacterium]
MILAIFTGLVLLLNIPADEIVIEYAQWLTIFAFLTAFALSFGVLLTEGELSPAHLVGILAFLSLPEEVLPATTWSIFIGAIFGAIAWALRAQIETDGRRRAFIHVSTGVYVISRLTLSFWAPAQVYLALGGALPLGQLPPNLGPDIFWSLIAYSLVYVTLYFSIFLLGFYLDRRPVGLLFRNDLLRIVVVLILPIPFGVLGAEVLNTLSNASQVILIVAIVLIILGLYALSTNEYRLRKQLDEMRTLAVVTRAMRAHLDLTSLLKTIYIQIAHLLNIDNFMVALFDNESGQAKLDFPLVVKQGQEETTKHIIVDYQNTLIGRVLTTGLPLLIESRVEREAKNLGLEVPDTPIHSWLGVPLLAGGRTLGAIVVYNYDSHRSFSGDDLRLLNLIAASSSIAIENAQLYQQQTERAEQLITLNRIASLLSGTLSPETVLDAVISSASMIANSTAAGVYLFWDDAKQTLPLVRSAGLSDDFTIDAPDPLMFRYDGPQFYIPLTVGDVRTDKRTAAIEAILERENKRAFVELPLVTGQERLGILVLYYDQPQTFTGDKVELLKTFANQASQAITNARVYAMTDEAFQRSVEQLLALAAIGRSLASTIDFQVICELVLGHATESTKVDVGMVVLRDEIGEIPQVVSSRGYTVDDFANFDLFKDGIQGRVWATGQTYLANDVANDEYYVQLAPHVRSQLSVPIVRGKDTLGVITLENSRLNGFTPEDTYFVSQIANQAAISLDNARLFYRITEARDRLQVLLDAMEEAIMLIDEKGLIALANPGIDLIGLRHEDLMEKPLLEILEEPSFELVERAGFASKAEVEDLVVNLSQARIYPAVNYVVRGEHGELHIRRQIVPVRQEENKIIGLLLVFYNKTEEEELARAREELSRMIVHDLRSPLTAVTTSLKLLQDYVPKDAKYRPL